jgi:hypothetical protein
MNIPLRCPCGHLLPSFIGLAGGCRQLARSGASTLGRAIRCPACGRLLGLPMAGDRDGQGGLRSLWPRLAVAAGLTLVFVIAATFLLVHLLPARQHGSQKDLAAVGPTPTPAEPATALPSPPSPAPIPSRPEPTPAVPVLEKPPARDVPAVKPLEPTPAPPPRTIEIKPPVRPALPPPPAREPEPRPPGLREGDSFFQEVMVGRVSAYRVLGTDLGQNVQYLLVSRFTVKKVEADGGLIAQQKVEGVRLANADPAMQAQLNDLLQKTKGATFTWTFNAQREVTHFEGGKEAIQVFKGTNPLGGPTFLLWSFLDQDGWKELAQITFFRPPDLAFKGGRGRGQKWTRPMSHSWGPLGHWAGRVSYAYTASKAGLDQYAYVLDLAYRPPQMAGNLPFQVAQSDFRLQTAQGTIVFDPARGRITAAEERFHVRGALAISYLGVDAAVEMDEAQIFRLRLLDRNPLEK